MYPPPDTPHPPYLLAAADVDDRLWRCNNK